MPAPPDPTRRRPAGGPGAEGIADVDAGARRDESTAIAVLDTCARQVDGLAGLGADALVHDERLTLDEMVAGLDRIGRRLDAALVVLDLREPAA